MTLIAPAIGQMELLDAALKDASPEALVLCLYSNDYDPVNGSLNGSFTEATIAGYASKTLTRAGWNAAVNGNPSSSTYGTAQTFNFTGTGQVVGYYLKGATSGNVYWAERLYPTTGQQFKDGDSLTITPKITMN